MLEGGANENGLATITRMRKDDIAGVVITDVSHEAIGTEMAKLNDSKDFPVCADLLSSSRKMPLSSSGCGKTKKLAAGKGTVIGPTHSLAQKGGHFSVSVCVRFLGRILLKRMLAVFDRPWFEQLKKSNALQRTDTPEDVAATVTFFLLMTPHIIRVKPFMPPVCKRHNLSFVMIRKKYVEQYEANSSVAESGHE